MTYIILFKYCNTMRYGNTNLFSQCKQLKNGKAKIGIQTGRYYIYTTPPTSSETKTTICPPYLIFHRSLELWYFFFLPSYSWQITLERSTNVHQSIQNCDNFHHTVHKSTNIPLKKKKKISGRAFIWKINLHFHQFIFQECKSFINFTSSTTF